MKTLNTIIHQILEAGAGGHMLYPFELNGVNNGKDLLDIYYKSIESLKVNPASVKVDGMNLSIKLIDENGKKEFALDRASSKEDDVRGVTINRLEQRFGSGHGMIKCAETILNLFNNNINKIKKYLINLGMWDDNTLIINIEYVNTSSNYGFSINYNEDMIVLHNMRKIERLGRKTNTYEVQYSQKDIDGIVNILSNEFKVYGNIPATFSGNPIPEIKKLLNEKIYINISKEETMEIRFKDILKKNNPALSPARFKTPDSKLRTSMNKQLMVDVIYNKRYLSYLLFSNMFYTHIFQFQSYFITFFTII